MAVDKVAQGGAPKAPAKDDGAASAAGRGQRNCLHKQLRKTKFCMFHLQGTCQFGKDCAFAHSLAEMNGTPDLRKTQLCKAFAEGRCDDPACNFAHGEIELRSTDMFFKKSLCIWNEKGKCRNESQCRFAHGLAELRSHQAGALAAQQAAQQAQRNIQQPFEQPGLLTQQNQEKVAKAARRRKGKQSQNSVSGINQQLMSGMEFPQTGQLKKSSSNSSRSGSSCDQNASTAASSGTFSRQTSEPMKVQPQASISQDTMIGQQQPNFDVTDHMGSMVAGLAAKAQLQRLQRQYQDKYQEALVNRSLGQDYVEALEHAWVQQQLQQANSMAAAAATGKSLELQADLESLRKGIGLLAAQCNQIQQQLQTKVSSTVPPYTVGGLLQSSGVGRAYPSSPESVQQLLWQLQMQAEQ